MTTCEMYGLLIDQKDGVGFYVSAYIFHSKDEAISEIEGLEKEGFDWDFKIIKYNQYEEVR